LQYSLIIKIALVLGFTIGAGIFWITLFSGIRFSRTSRFVLMVERMKARSNEKNGDSQVITRDIILTPKQRVYYDRSKLAGLTASWSYRNFQTLRITLAIILVALGFMSQVPDLSILVRLTFGSWFILILILAIIGLVGYFLPLILLIASASHKRTKILMEISKLSHRLAICVSEKADIREMILRASRPLKIMRPHIQDMAAMWGKDQKEAIWNFKEAVGISEVFPLVNALIAISQAKKDEVVQLLKDQTKSIDATLESEINRRIENAPMWISFYIMIPFGFILVLFLYPWLVTVQEQLMTSFLNP
jgi:hypothetical protein